MTVNGKPDWIFIKLYCHGLFDQDQSACIGEDAKRFFGDLVEQSEKSDAFKVHFATAREAFNIALAAIDNRSGDPDQYRNYRLRSIMKTTASVGAKEAAVAV